MLEARLQLLLWFYFFRDLSWWKKEESMLKKIPKINTFLLLTVLSLPSVFYLLVPGFYEPHDLHHFADIYEMYRAFASGQIPPRLGPDFIFGYGYPLFNFYYVLPFYIGSLFFAAFKSIQF